MTPTHTALIVEIPAAEPAVAHHRARLDLAASWGVPAHITIVYPFLPPTAVTDAVLAGLREAIGAIPRFTTALTHVGWFGDTVAWLAPDPDAPFRALTHAVTTRFPDAQPYGGAHPELIPHLTIGHDHPPHLLRAAADEAANHLPIAADITAVHLIQGIPAPGGPWHRTATLPLGPTAR
ncbi:2'-5' RNA ligase family protein [Actinoplanes sp. NPDC051346]|uniref:2'-5' RNA ligase family protein n=1 Tax=Actinoplanes sp. NPDC051346 TaxID=3155048 RepID=UPI003435C00B